LGNFKDLRINGDKQRKSTLFYTRYLVIEKYSDVVDNNFGTLSRVKNIEGRSPDECPKMYYLHLLRATEGTLRVLSDRPARREEQILMTLKTEVSVFVLRFIFACAPLLAFRMLERAWWEIIR
jgi:hypothetical protein